MAVSRGPSGSAMTTVHGSRGPGVSSGLNGPRHMSTLGPRTAGMWKGNTWDGRHHHHHHRDRFFFGAGFAGSYYDYGYYDSCWRLVPTYYGGWQRVWACDYPYWGY